MKSIAVAKPQWISLLILVGSWFLVQALPIVFTYPLSESYLVFAHGLIAAAMTWFLSLPVWWLLINASFPLAVFYAVALQWPPIGFLAAFILLLLIYWSNFLTRVPYYPSQQSVHELVGQLLPIDSDRRFLDLGSGLGGLCFHINKQQPDWQVVGIEIAPLPWLFTWLVARFKGLSCQFILGNYQKHHLGEYSLVFAYLSPAAMPGLWVQACQQMRPGSILVSCEFAIPGQNIEPIYLGDQTPVYVWQIDSVDSKEDWS
jgi:SAM-dependent methyltransferase